MSRKKWTPKTEISDSILHHREKKKWQIALRRYVLEKQKSTFYAPFFGLDIEKFREWIELQFEEGLSWENFSKEWQFDHIVPLSYFDFDDREDLKLCWNFTNIRVQPLAQEGTRRSGIDVLAAKSYFDSLYQKTGYAICRLMVEKITRIEAAEMRENQSLIEFITNNKAYLEETISFSAEDFSLLNSGKTVKSIVFEKEFLKKLGS